MRTINDDKISLDRKTFKVLASDTRVKILKYLNQRRMTLSELSKKLGMSVSTVKEHLDNLTSVDLIIQKDEGRKWKYYELTRKGKDIVNPSEKRVFFILSLSILATIASFYNLVNKFQPTPQVMGRAMDKAVAESVPLVESVPISAQIPYFEIILVVSTVLITGIILGYLITNRRTHLINQF